MRQKFDTHLTEEQTRVLADWLTLAVFTQQPKSARQLLDDASFTMPEMPPELVAEEALAAERVVFVTLADGQGAYATAYARAEGLHAAGEQALRTALRDFAGRMCHHHELLQQRIKRIKVDIVSDVVALDTDRIFNQQAVIADRSLVGVSLNNFDTAWLPEESLRYNWVTRRGKLKRTGDTQNEQQTTQGETQPLSALQSQSDSQGQVNRQTHSQRLLKQASIFGVISRLVVLNLKGGGQLEIENAPLYRNHRHAPELNELAALEAAVEGADYIARHTYVAPQARSTNNHPNPDLTNANKLHRERGLHGAMNYQYDAGNDRAMGGYNILRHCGSLWSMLQVYRDKPTVALYKASHAALDYLKSCIVPFSSEHKNAYVVRHNDEAKLGGNGLGLVALAAAYRELNATEVLSLMQGLARWITGTQAKSGAFMYHKIYMDKMQNARFQSDYYPGEAILGLMQLYKIDRNYKWLEAADRAAQWLINVRDHGKSIAELNRDHWLLYALNDLYRELPRPMFLEHTVRILDCVQQAQIKQSQLADVVGGFQNPLNVTATACMCEGMIAGYTLLTDMQHRIDTQPVPGFDAQYLERLEQSIEAGLRLQLQFRFDAYNSTYLANPAKAKGGFQSSPLHWNIRVDFPQHSLTSFLMYWRLTRGSTFSMISR